MLEIGGTFSAARAKEIEGSKIVRLGVVEFNLVNVRADSAPRLRGVISDRETIFCAHFQSQEYVRISLSDG
jgi:hypothetical protein